jgi:ABC-type glutathione transport system ATPase component
MTSRGVTSIPAIQVRRLSKSFAVRGAQPRVALEDVSFEVERGRTTAIIGESGAGKSTLVRCVAGLERPTSGKILIDGTPFGLRYGRIGPVQMVFQNPSDALDPMRSVGSSIAAPLRGWSRAGRRAWVEELLSLVGINPARRKDRPREFSGGQLQRIVIARALAPNPDVLLCDEPTSALDVSVQAQILNLLLTLQEKHGFASVVVTHDLAVAKVLADDVVVLRRGRMLFHGTVDELIDPVRSLDPYVEDLVRASRKSEFAVEHTDAYVTAEAS